MQVIFHCATAAPAAENTGNRQMMHDVNVTGTQNVLAAAVRHGVPKLVYTSSASVVFEGRDLIGVDESAPYATKPLDYYTSTKVLFPCLHINGSSGRRVPAVVV
jgi:sterol-4alpha-carboxylate 3-dehydrogenase (decarboxylating)